MIRAGPTGLGAAGHALAAWPPGRRGAGDETEGLMLDPVCTAQALALVPDRRAVIFWPTGGVLDAAAAAQGASS